MQVEQPGTLEMGRYAEGVWGKTNGLLIVAYGRRGRGTAMAIVVMVTSMKRECGGIVGRQLLELTVGLS